MTCDEIQDRLLTADDVANIATHDAEVAAHLRACPACATIVTQLGRLDAATRAITVPSAAMVEDAKGAFLQSIGNKDVTGNSDEPIRLPTASARLRRAGAQQVSNVWRIMPRFAAAAAVVLLIGSGIWVLTGDVSSADASSAAVVEQLVRWNVNLAEADSPEERSEIFANAGALKQKVAKVKLLPEDRELAKMLLDNGQALATTANDPLNDVERLNDTAEQLLKRIQIATSRRNIRAVRAYSRNYALLRATAGADHLKKLEPLPGEDVQHLDRLEQMIRRDSDLQRRLQKLLEQSPAATRQEIIQSLNLPQPPKPNFRRPGQRPSNNAGSTTRPTRPSEHSNRPPRPDSFNANAPLRDPQLSEKEQQMREQRVREWFAQYKRKQKAREGPTSKPVFGPLPSTFDLPE